ncbi:hypothetical protein ACGFZ4_43465, partial [Streptomyces adustus]
GRTWRRKAPVESLMPLRLARYGVPLSETAPAGLAAAGIEPVLIPPAPQPALTTEAPAPLTAAPRAVEAAPDRQQQAPAAQQQPAPADNGPYAQEPAYVPDPDQSPWFVEPPHQAEYQGGYDPTYDPEQQYAEQHQDPSQHNEEPPPQEPSPEETGTFPIPARRPEGQPREAPALPALTQVDRYYLAWRNHLRQHGTEPAPDELSRHLSDQGIHDHQGHPVKPKTLARYLLRFRIYTVWAQLRDLNHDAPPLEHVLKHLAQQGITAQYGKPLTPTDLTPHLTSFERRYHALNHHTQPGETLRTTEDQPH